MGDNFKINLDQIEALGINCIGVIDDVSSSHELQQSFAKYKRDNLKTLHQVVFDKDYKKMYEDNQTNYAACFKKLADSVSDMIQKALEKDERILLLSSEQDNIVAAIIMYFLMKNYQFSYTNALTLVKDRRISIKLDKK